MPRYIDADALVAEIKKDDTYQNWLFRKMIEKQPVITPDDVRGVGEWVKDNYFAHIKLCSKCGKRKGIYDIYKFCPNCGARMKGAEDGTTD